jgi:NAD-dependent dihydropyrimidine dehydrogenase PreA subunit
MGIFIEISVDSDALDAATSKAVVSVCPVDIFALDGDKVIVRPDQEDECTLCRLCLERAPAGTIRIRKTYKDEVLVREAAQ